MDSMQDMRPVGQTDTRFGKIVKSDKTWIEKLFRFHNFVVDIHNTLAKIPIL